jgi:hypothetical protein
VVADFSHRQLSENGNNCERTQRVVLGRHMPLAASLEVKQGRFGRLFTKLFDINPILAKLLICVQLQVLIVRDLRRFQTISV